MDFTDLNSTVKIAYGHLSCGGIESIKTIYYALLLQVYKN